MKYFGTKAGQESRGLLQLREGAMIRPLELEAGMILVVDDDAGIVKLLRTALEAEKFEVLTAADGVEAFKLVRTSKCKCLVLDM